MPAGLQLMVLCLSLPSYSDTRERERSFQLDIMFPFQKHLGSLLPIRQEKLQYPSTEFNTLPFLSSANSSHLNSYIALWPPHSLHISSPKLLCFPNFLLSFRWSIPEGPPPSPFSSCCPSRARSNAIFSMKVPQTFPFRNSFLPPLNQR